MATQIGTTREFSSVDERNRGNLRNCPQCKVNVVPRGITSSLKDDLAVGEKKHCPNCGHVFGNNSLLPRKVTFITVTGAAGATTITTLAGTLQLSAATLPDYADNKAVTWSVNDATKATVDADTGKLTAVKNGVVRAIATAKDGGNAVGWLDVTITNNP